MSVVYHLSEEELNESFLQSLKAFVKGKKSVRIEVVEEIDDSDYLMSTEKNHHTLLQSIAEAERGEGLVKVSIDDLRKLVE